MDDVTTKVALIIGSLKPGAQPAALALESLEVVELVEALESGFALSIPAREVTEENFTSVDSVAALMQRLGAA